MGGLRSGRATVFVNGHEVGQTDESFRGLKGEVDALEAWTVDSRDLRPGSNVLALRFEWTLPGDDGVADARLLLGVREQLMPYYLRASDTRRFVQNGALALFVFMLVLLGTLLSREADPHRRALQRSTLCMVAAAALYLAPRTLLSPKQSAPVTFTLLVARGGGLRLDAARVLPAVLPRARHPCREGPPDHLRHVRGRLRRGVRARPGAGSVALYRLFTLYIFASMLYVTALTTVTLFRRKRASDLVFAGSLFSFSPPGCWICSPTWM